MNRRLRGIPSIRLRALALAAAAIGIAATGCGGPEEEAGDGSGPPRVGNAAVAPPECVVQDYPCTWAEVDVSVGERIEELLDPVIDLMYDESPTALWEWLGTQPDIVDRGVSGDSLAIWYRLEGGRRVYVMAPHRHLPYRDVESVGLRSLLPGSAPLHAGVGGAFHGLLERMRERAGQPLYPAPFAAVVPADVAGRDRNSDTRINQRDERRALVLDPLYFEFCYQAIEDALPDDKSRQTLSPAISAACDGSGSVSGLGVPTSALYVNGDQVADELRAIPAFRDVTLLRDSAADHSVVSQWGEYDVIHLATHGSGDIWGMGRIAPMPRRGIWPTPPDSGLVMIKSRAGKFGPNRVVWAFGLDYLRKALPNGLDKTFVFADACNTQGVPGKPAPDLAPFLLGGGRAGLLGWAAEVEWDDSQMLSGEVYDLLSRGWTVPQALDSLRERRTTYLRGGGGTPSHLAATLLNYEGNPLRLFEIPVLIDPGTAVPNQPGTPLVDGDPVDRFISGALGDGQDDELNVDVEVMAITDAQAPSTMVHLELDGTPIGTPQPLGPNALVSPNRYRTRFLQTPVGKDLQIDVDYELEAVVALPEGEESRYAARLRSESCVVPTQGDFYGELKGQRGRTIDRLGREGFAKILRAPLFGDWALQVENLPAPPGKDLSLTILFDGTPEVGTTVKVSGAGYTDPKFGGGVDERDQRVSWYRGTAEITFTGVVPRPDKPYDWVCGRITADLIGQQEPPPGSYTPVDVPATFVGSFMAEWYPDR